MPYINDGEGNKVWKPFARQEEFIHIPFSVFEAFYGGAVGGGKSELLLMLPIIYGWHLNPRFKGVIFRRTFPELEESLIPRSRELYEAAGGVYNATNHVWTFPDPTGSVKHGATIRFSYLDTNDDARSHDTAEYHYIAFDELTHFTEFMYTYMISRIRTTDPTLPPIIRSASNPGNIGHSWVRKRFVEPCVAGNVLIYNTLTKSHSIFIPAKAADNPHLAENDPNYLNRLANLPEADRKAKVDGDWWAFEGQVFIEFREKKLFHEPENAIHVIEPFQIYSWWPKVISIDWGFKAITWVGWFAVSPDGRAFLYREYSAQKTNISVWGVDIARLSLQDENIQDIRLDPSAWQNRGEELNIAQQIMQATGFDCKQAENDRVGGKLLLHEMLRWKDKPPRYIPREGYQQTTFDRLVRIHSLTIAKEYQKLFLPEPPERNIPRLQIFNTCPKVIAAIQSATYDEKRPEDVKEWEGDDPYDGLRYGLKAIDNYTSESSDSYKRLAKTEAIVNEFARTSDATRFYRKMEHLEKQSRSVIPFVARGNGGKNLTALARGRQR